MSKMFDKYTKSVDFTPITPFRPEKPSHKTIGSGAVKLLKDIKGNELGVEAPRGSIFSLYFTFDGEVENMSLSEFLDENTIMFKVYDHRRNLVYQTEADIDYNVAKVDIISDGVDCLPYGNYFFELLLITDEFNYTIINDKDAIISII